MPSLAMRQTQQMPRSALQNLHRSCGLILASCKTSFCLYILRRRTCSRPFRSRVNQKSTASQNSKQHAHIGPNTYSLPRFQDGIALLLRQAPNVLVPGCASHHEAIVQRLQGASDTCDATQSLQGHPTSRLDPHLLTPAMSSLQWVARDHLSAPVKYVRHHPCAG